MEYLLAIDAGTTSIKTAIFSMMGKCLGVERMEYKLDTPSAEIAELDALVYWQSCVKNIRTLLANLAIQGDEIKAVCISSQGETLITLDQAGKAIYPAIVWVDNRAEKQAQELARQFESQAYERTGIPEIVPTWPACKILWLRENEPDVFSRVNKFLLVQDYLIYRLSGRFVTDGSVSCTTLYYDIRRNVWWEEMCSAVGINPSQLPEIESPGAYVGNIRPQAADELGLSTDTMVVCGGMDQPVGAIGAGNIRSGIISESTGAALAIHATIEEAMLDQCKPIPVYVHSVVGKYFLDPVCPTGGMAFKWYRDQFGQEELREARKEGKDAYDLLTNLAENAPPGCDGLVMLPHLMGAFSPEINSLARGSFTGFTLSHTRAHFTRAVLEGVAFMLKRNIDFIKQAGIEVSEIVATGGGSRSRLWNQIKANVCNCPVFTLENEETALIGNAILAGVASGVFASIQDGCHALVHRRERFDPNAEMPAYKDAYQRYCLLDQSLSDYFRTAYSKP